MNEENINIKINDFLNIFHKRNYLLANNLETLYKMSINMYQILYEVCNDNFLEDVENTERISPLMKFEIIKDYYKSNNIDVNIDKLINDGTIGFRYVNVNDSKYSYSIFGKNYYEKGKKLIDICNNGLVIDIPIIVHELSHLRNQPNNGRGVIDDTLTEPLAIAEEFVFCDYLSSIGYSKEAHLNKKDNLFGVYQIVKKFSKILKVLLVFNRCGSFTKENYIKYFNNDLEYNELVEQIKELDINNTYLYNELYYIMGFALGIYMYEEYQKDNSFINNMKKLHIWMNEKDMYECFKVINLEDLEEEDIKKIMISIENFRESFKNKSNEIIKK